MLHWYIPLLVGFSVTCSAVVHRLPDNVIPTNYDLRIQTDIEGLTYSGVVSIQISCKISVNIITLHAKQQDEGLDVIEDKIKVLKSNNVNDNIGADSISIDHENGFLTIKLNTMLESGKNYVLVIPFEGKVSASMQGYFVLEHIEQNSLNSKYLLATDFKRTLARTVFPCFDEPNMKANYTITLGMRDNERSISNMKLLKREPMKERQGWSWNIYVETSPLSTFQVSFIVTNINLNLGESIAPPPVGIQIKCWAHEELKATTRPTSFMFGEYLKQLTVKFGLPRITPDPLQKIDYLLIHSEDDLDISNLGIMIERDADFVDRGSREDRAISVHHMYEQVARQWFGAVVSPKWWDSEWLLRALARYVPLLLLPSRYFDTEIFPTFLSVMDWDSERNSLRLSDLNEKDLPLEESEERIDKGLMLLRMVHLTVGDHIFTKGVQELVRKHRFSSVSTGDFWKILDEQLQAKKGFGRRRKSFQLPPGVSVGDIMSSWTDQEGYPIITVERNYNNGNAKITQERYIGRYSERKEESETSLQSKQGLPGCWWIPLTFSTDAKDFKNTQPVIWQSCHNQKTGVFVKTGAGKSNWVIFNNRFSGMYRINYDDSNWRLITDALKNVMEYPTINVLSRAQLVNDALSLSWTGDLGFEPAFRLLSYIRHEDDLVVWRAFFIGASNFKNVLKRSQLFGQFQQYIKSILNGKYKVVFPSKEIIADYINKDKDTANPFTKLLIHMWSGNFEVRECVTQSKALFADWMQKGEIPKAVREYPRSLILSILCSTLRDNNAQREFQFVFNELKKTQPDHLNRQLLLEVLACTNDGPSINSLLQWSTAKTNDNVNIEEKQQVFINLLKGKSSFEPSVQYFYNNFYRIYRFYKNNLETIASYTQAMASEMNPDQLQRLQSFVKMTRELNNKNIISAINQGQAVAKRKSVWLEDNSNAFRDALEKLNTGNKP